MSLQTYSYLRFFGCEFLCGSSVLPLYLMILYLNQPFQTGYSKSIEEIEYDNIEQDSINLGCLGDFGLIKALVDSVRSVSG